MWAHQPGKRKATQGLMYGILGKQAHDYGHESKKQPIGGKKYEFQKNYTTLQKLLNSEE